MTIRDYYVINRRSGALVIHCVDHRFQEAFGKFIFKELKIDVYNPVAISGGIYALCDGGDRNYEFIWDQIKFIVENMGIKKVVIINHEDCRWYQNENPDLGPTELNKKCKADLARAADKIKEKFAGIEVFPVWAELDGDIIRFHRLY